MSVLQKQLLGGKMLPPMGPRSTANKAVGGGLHGPGPRKRSYSPVSWEVYWHKKETVETARGKFLVYSRGEGETLVLLLHGGGYSGLTWSLAAEHLNKLAGCRVAALDLRGHGETVASQEEEKEGDGMSKHSLARDVRAVGDQLLIQGGHKHLVLVGHSLGGAVAVAAAELEGGVAGLIVIDVVEGTALESLAHMQTFLRSRPQEFRSVEHAIEWCVRSGQVRNLQSAKVSMPGQVVDASGQLASAQVPGKQSQLTDSPPAGDTSQQQHLPPSHFTDAIAEESDDGENDEGIAQREAQQAESAAAASKPRSVAAGAGPYRWAVDLSATEPHWRGWFEHLSAGFLNVTAAKLLLLAGVDRLDRDLTVGQMQGKFQLIVLPQVGHAIHEDSPDKVGEVIAQFLVRNRLAETRDPELLPPPPPVLGLHP